MAESVIALPRSVTDQIDHERVRIRMDILKFASARTDQSPNQVVDYCKAFEGWVFSKSE